MNNSFEKYNPRNEHIYTIFKVIDTCIFNLCPPGLHFLEVNQKANWLHISF